MTSKLNANSSKTNSSKDNNNNNNNNSKKSNLNRTSLLQKTRSPQKFKLNETTKYNRVILNSFRLPDSSEYDDDNTEEADTSTSIHLNSDFASFSSNEYNNNNNNSNRLLLDNYTSSNSSGFNRNSRQRASIPTSTNSSCPNHSQNHYYQVDDFRFLKFDPFDRVVSRLSGKLGFISNEYTPHLKGSLY